jgi:BirA family biotin operon repressor/biotin-[acetyl-CoA-carboxylase] ligase
MSNHYFRVQNYTIALYRDIPSTNKTAQTLAINGAPERTAVLASFQSKGIGRLNRSWFCPPGRGIMISLVLRPALTLEFIQGLTLLCSVAVVDAIKDVADCNPGIKWSNDILINDKKVCGILAQSGIDSDSKQYVIMGIGLNVNQNVAELPDDCRDRTTSLRIESPNSKRISRMKVLMSFLRNWESHYASYLAEGWSYLREVWIERNVTLGRQITFSGNQHGIARDISPRGGIIIETADGQLVEFQSEELSLGASFY